MKHIETANRINEALTESGLTAQELANRTGLNKASISQYRNGTHKPSNKTATLIGDVLDVNPLWLMGFDVRKKEPLFFKKTMDYNYIFNYIQTADANKLREIRRYIEFVIEGGDI